jgi:aspartate 1-decarboxylase
MALIPSHWAFIQQLIEDHVIETYAISADRTRGWVTINGEDAAAVQAVVEQFPLYDFITEVEIDELFIFDSAKTRFPRLSLN